MKFLNKKVCSLLICMSMIFAFSTNAWAHDMSEETIVDGSKLTTDLVAESTMENLSKGNILNKGVASIGNNGNGSVNVAGTVFGSVVCDKLILKMTLQRYSNGYWYDVKSFSNTAYNTAYLTKSYNVSVTKGYYYRVKAACFATKGSTTESKSPVTNGIWID